MASRAACAAVPLWLHCKLYVSGQRCYVRLAAIQTVEMACYAWLGAQVMLFFARHASLRGQSKTLRSHRNPQFSYHSMRRADYPS